MKHILKKISAFALAFTILGAGSVMTKTVSPKSDNTLDAHAACVHGQGVYTTFLWVTPHLRVAQVRCCGCHGVLETYTAYFG
ncbi:hypothetical protein [Ruminococcus flavefaciens]|jgi:hypothetical protein|uniref:hypothetical protein n=1 Tax=Ruminococcus flavefaciens TaxID=1265 RepID=UPI0013DA941F|nr:hypothetical protein [Ruminococcus flavefaciens]MBQ6168546.1 hypothetical protein [Ruminococcus sp.]